mgnify:CR=1 FL=1
MKGVVLHTKRRSLDFGFQFKKIPTFGKFCGIVYFGVCEDWREMGGVWDCIDCIADLDKLDQGIHLELANGSDDIGKITIETRQMSDTFFVI